MLANLDITISLILLTDKQVTVLISLVTLPIKPDINWLLSLTLSLFILYYASLTV